MGREQLYASFLLDRDQGLEIAIAAESVTEATPIAGNIQPLPASVDFLEGLMQLRTDVIPVINLKKRLGLPNTAYGSDAKVAVIMLAHQQFGLLFDDIRDVLRVDRRRVVPIPSALQAGERIISDLIKLETGARTLELLDLRRLFPDDSFLTETAPAPDSQKMEQVNRTYQRFVVFSSDGQDYGVPVEYAREITFLTQIDSKFKTGCLEGALQLRGQTVPVLHAGALLSGRASSEIHCEGCRILVLTTDSLVFGMVVDAIREIVTVASNDILPMPSREDQSVSGIYEEKNGRNIMLLNVANLLSGQMSTLKSMARLRKVEDEEQEVSVLAGSRHLITENCYLVFTVEMNFAIEIKDVQEIIERRAVMTIPAAEGFDTEVINLRGKVVPVVNLRRFYGYTDREEVGSRLIICKDGSRFVALEVDNIVTIYKQEQYFATPSLNPQLQPRKDTLDRLIEFVGEEGIKEHVLVVNMHNLVRNHLQSSKMPLPPDAEDGLSDTESNLAAENL